MIPAHELRLGNYFYSDKIQQKTPNNIHRVQGNDIFVAQHQPEWFEPIPVTSELLQAVFTDSQTDIIVTDAGEITVTAQQVINRKPRTYKPAYIEHLDTYVLLLLLSGTDSVEMGAFQYVHQLQNLWFAVTGEELEIPINFYLKYT